MSGRETSHGVSPHALKPGVEALKLSQVEGQQFAGSRNLVPMLVQRLGVYRWLNVFVYVAQELKTTHNRKTELHMLGPEDRNGFAPCPIDVVFIPRGRLVQIVWWRSRGWRLVIVDVFHLHLARETVASGAKNNGVGRQRQL